MVRFPAYDEPTRNLKSRAGVNKYNYSDDESPPTASKPPAKPLTGEMPPASKPLVKPPVRPPTEELPLTEDEVNALLGI